MFIKIRRDTLVILLLAFILILSGRVMTYLAYASSTEDVNGVPIAGIIVKGNDIVPLSSIKANIYESGLRPGSYIKGDVLVTSKRKIPLSEAIENAEKFVKKTTIPGTRVTPIAAADVKVDTKTGIVTVNVIEDFATVKITNRTGGSG
ncbi:hypothetical protein U2150_04335 [Methanothermobacter wolfeii]|uniref:Uncharacterized protein n=1 Tax=Methanothermobacter wolfeii TaxID=145261 RepID=A0A9E7UMA3_METWO|nr:MULTISPECIES: hypothetical protein [Methanothermobacter]MDI6702949.1 hypothetical protein [Methanothermobacter wolfeii]MDI6842180.1 hypothetical protein [Methanothermobacter wolfeii]NLM02361.1 hypothetical protein [Methanothermobacter wolfeii]QHN06516.1 hypothetical protein FZP57_05250 [Methanothermobacter sp. THM-1]UXH31043.1 hypothetical protein N5910_05700 [Methanothermobacter wolfeii]